MNNAGLRFEHPDFIAEYVRIHNVTDGIRPACFTVTTDRSVWDNAVAPWKARHAGAP